MLRTMAPKPKYVKSIDKWVYTPYTPNSEEAA